MRRLGEQYRRTVALNGAALPKRSPLIFFPLALALAGSFWALGIVVNSPKVIPMNLPWSSFAIIALSRGAGTAGGGQPHRARLPARLRRRPPDLRHHRPTDRQPPPPPARPSTPHGPPAQPTNAGGPNGRHHPVAKPQQTLTPP